MSGGLFTRRRLAAAACLLLASWLVLAFYQGKPPAGAALPALWPSVVALTGVLILRHALTGLLLGAVAGAVLLAGGNPWRAGGDLLAGHFAPIFASPWKTGAIAFTLLLGGFAAVIERGGGFRSLLERFLRGRGDPARRLQGGVMGLGLVCFFDGLANSMLVGRVTRTLADRCGVSRVKLAYIVDSTSAAVACLAFVSTWIAFQISMIHQGLELAGLPAEGGYALFFASIPLNFYCLLTLALLVIAIATGFNPGPMRAFEQQARTRAREMQPHAPAKAPAGPAENLAPAWTALLPLAVLVVTLLGGFYALGLNWDRAPGVSPAALWPVTGSKIATAFGSNAGPVVLVAASIVATLAALAVFPVPPGRGEAIRAHARGVRELAGPVLILLAAWMLGSTLEALGTGGVIAGLAGGALPLALLPALVFVAGALTSFTTGTSWGTMGLLMPLVIPALAAHPEAAPGEVERFFALGIAAVFSGAVFGDHCSPISDTTIVSSIATGVEPLDHVRTQLPFALIAAVVAAFVGFIPAGLGLPAWMCLTAGVALLGVIAHLGRRHA